MSVGPVARIVIEVLWSVGLGVALLATLVILKESFLVLGVLQDIHRLARLIERAAEGVAANLHSVDAIQRAARATQPLPAALGRVSEPLLALTKALRQEVKE